ncbi:MAG: hypothetical protein ACRDNB_02540 [Gaiellaceae bacterium]
MAAQRLGKLVWPGVILAGLALGGFVFLSWPDSTTRVVRLPYGESLPKTPHEAAVAPPQSVGTRTTAAAPAVAAQPPPGTAAAADEGSRVLAVVEPDRAFAAGPAPFPSLLELDPNYVQEPPEELGAEPLPGAKLTPEPPPVAG